MTDYDEQFNLRKRHPSGRIHLLVNELQSIYARWKLSASLDVLYGDTAGQRLDVFPARRPDAPVFVFIHGGYFRALDKRQYSYLALPIVAAGGCAVVLNYDLAPAVRVEEIVDQNLRAFRHVRDNAQRWNGDPSRIVLFGHSVGAFLVAKILEVDWPASTRRSLVGAALLSGLYDLGPMRQSYLNATLKLTADDVERLSPVAGRIDVLPPSTLIAVGAEETEEFIRQSTDYAAKLEADGHRLELLVLEGENHYTVSRLLSHRSPALMDKILTMADLG